MMKKVLIAALLLGAVALAYFLRFSPSARKASHLARAERYFHAGEFDKARLEYLNVLRRDSSERVALERLGTIWLELGVPLQAVPFMLRVKELEPAYLENRRRAAAACLAIGEFEMARQEAEAVLDQSPADLTAWTVLADSAFTPEQVEAVEERAGRQTEPVAGAVYARGVLALKKDDLDTAEQSLREALKLDPTLYRAHFRLADVYQAKQQPEKMEEELQAGAAAAPRRSLEKLRHAELQIQNGKPALAREFLTPLLQEVPNYLPAWVTLARAEFAEKKYPEALVALQNVLNRDAGQPDARLLQGQVQVASGDAAAGIETLEKLTKAFPRSALAKMELGRAFAAANRKANAAEQFREALALNPGLTDVQIWLAEWNLGQGLAQPVIDALQPVVARRPELVRPGIILADAYRLVRRHDDAAAIYQKQAELAPQSAGPLLFLGAILREQRKFDQARAVFEKAAQLAPENLSIIGNLTDLDMMRRDFASAKARLDPLKEETRKSAGAKIIEARIHVAQDQLAEAEAALLAAIQANPDSTIAYEMLVAVYYRQNRVPDAIARVAERLQHTPEDAGSRLLLARLYEHQKDVENARAAYEQVLVHRPDSPDALNNLAYLLSESLNQPERAEAFARKARNLRPNDASIADTLGWVLYRRGDYEGALDLLRESVLKLRQQGPVPAEVNFHFAMANSAMMNVAIATTAFEEAAADPADFPRKETIPFRLKLLQSGHAAPALSLAELEAARKENPSDPLILVRIGEAHEGQGKFADAAAAFEEALKRNPQLAIAAANLSVLYSQQLGDRAKALEYAKMARALAPTDANLAGRLGIAASRLDDLPWAFSLLQQAAAQSDAPQDTLLTFATVAYRLGKVKDTRHGLNRASESASGDNADPRIAEFRRMLDIADAPDDRAEADVAKVLEQDPKHPAALVARGVVLEGKGNWNEAAQAYEEALRHHPSLPTAQSRLAAAILESGSDADRALGLAMEARNAMPEDPFTALVLGRASYHKGEFSRAVTLLAEAGRAKPLNAKQLYFLGVAYVKVRNPQSGADALNRALAAGLQGPEREEAERLLASLPK